MSKPETQTRARIEAGLRRRYRAEMRFRFYGLVAVLVGLLSVVILFGNIFSRGWSAFRQAELTLTVTYDAELLGVSDVRDAEALAQADYVALIRAALREKFPEAQGRSGNRALIELISNSSSYELQRRLQADSSLLGKQQTLQVLTSANVDQYLKGRISREQTQEQRPLTDQQLDWLDQLRAQNLLQLKFNRGFFTNGDSREPEQAGVLGALVGSLYALLVTLLLSFPIGVAAAIYLEEFAPRNRWTDLVEVNINNLAAVPSVVFGLLGLAVFLNFFGLPRSAPLVGGLVLTLLTLPTIIIASRAAIKSIPPSLREAALGLGASKLQVVTHHVLPLAMPGILTGTIIGMARALGETAPLLMIGMVAFIVDVPQKITDPATALPVQIYLWSDSPERAFTERTSAAIIVLLVVLVIMNAAAVWLRSRFERRW